MKITLGIFGIILAIAIAIGLLVLYSFVILWNVTDIYNNGLNFWNTFWLLLVASSGVVSVRAIK